jgi:hypothetical protein
VEAARIQVDLRDVPVPGRPVGAEFRLRDPLPEDALVRLASARDSGWRLEPAEFRAGDAPLAASLAAPADLDVRPGFLRPPLRLHRSVAHGGREYSGRDVAVGLTPGSVRLLMPEPEPSLVPRAPADVVIDGCPDEWRGVPYLFLPSVQAPSRALRLGWSERGLLGALRVPGEDLFGIEIYLESDFGRSFSIFGNPHVAKYTLSPAPGRGPGRAAVRVAYGPCMHRPDLIEAAWQEHEGGCALEFLVPASALDGAAMGAGTVLGFHFVLSAGGRVLEQFVDPEGKPGVWHIPLYWGAVRLA